MKLVKSKRVKKIKEHKSDPATSTAAEVYRSVVHFSANQAQKSLLEGSVTNLDLWRATIVHWAEHGWNPRNLTGMLELYQRGGPQACRYCQIPREEGSAHQHKATLTTPLEQTLSAIDQLRKKQSDRDAHG
ncbi:MAG: hypothetical protein C3F13_18510 [Anaerolineales bacterium]|nr:MAG: hypothetical protein C3F13_18510 [Anaerolineales bacterium]